MVARILLLTTILSAAAQGSGSIYGRVTIVDTGAVAAEAKVSATCPADGDSVSTTTDRKGAYSLGRAGDSVRLDGPAPRQGFD